MVTTDKNKPVDAISQQFVKLSSPVSGFCIDNIPVGRKKRPLKIKVVNICYHYFK